VAAVHPWQDARTFSHRLPEDTMNTTTIVIGAAVFLFGVYTSVMRYARPQKLGKLVALQQLFGEKNGSLIHLLSYAVLPLVAGVIFLLAGMRGISLFG
jgi:hypothetical protein